MRGYECKIDGCTYTFDTRRDRTEHHFDTHGVVFTASGQALTEEDIERLADEAERGYNVPRKRTKPRR